MQKIANFIVDKYKIILFIFIILCILSCVAIPFVVKRLNSEVMSYLPSDTKTAEGLKFLSDNFGIAADAMFGVTGASVEEMKAIANDLEKLYYNEDNKNFYFSTDETDENEAGKKVITQCLWRYCDFVTFYYNLYYDSDQWKEIEKVFFDNGGTSDNFSDDTYVFLIMIDFSSSSDEAFKTLDIIENKIVPTCVEGEYSYYAFGTTKMAKDIFENTIGEVWAYTLAGFAIVLLVLFLFTKSWIDPIIILLTLGISILLNIGSNIIFESNSIITFASSSLLQMALSVDYAVFMLHVYREECKATEDRIVALKKSIPRAFKSVFASAMTTLGGFLALYFMRFGIGPDLGGVLAKGIFMSFISVLFVQPAFMIIFSKQMDKWQHKAVEWKFRKPVKTTIKYRSVIIALFLIAIFPVVLLQNDLHLNYFNFVKYDKQEGIVYDMVNTASRQLIIAVPLNVEDENSISQQYEYLEEIRAINDGEAVSFVLGLNALIPSEDFEYYMSNEIYRKIFLTQTKAFYNNGYTMYTVGLNCDDFESEQAFSLVAEIEQITDKNFKGSKTYITGLSQAGRDFAAITPNDFQRVSIASVLIIIFVLLITFRSVKHSIVLILLIEFGIWINLCIQSISGNSINFMSYIVISSIQLGATVDYAILITQKYRDLRKRMLPAHAAYQATTSSIMSVLTSATILAGACFCVRLMSTVLIVSEVTTLIAYGAIISALLTIFVLPAILAFMDRPNKWKTMEIPRQDKLSKRKYLKNKNKS